MFYSCPVLKKEIAFLNQFFSKISGYTKVKVTEEDLNIV